jgi:CARDB protein
MDNWRASRKQTEHDVACLQCEGEFQMTRFFEATLAGLGKRRAGACVAAVAAPLFLLLASPAYAAEPDLVVTQAKVRGKDYLFHDSTARDVVIEITVRNIGSAPAGRSVAYVNCFGEDRGCDGETIPRLGPGKAHSTVLAIQVNPRQLDFGVYFARVCADHRHDVEEQHEANNCTRGEDRPWLSIIPRTWVGHVSGSSTHNWGGAAKETWRINSVEFTFDAEISPRFFLYELTDARIVAWRSSGTDDKGCGYSGQAPAGTDLGAGGGSLALNLTRPNVPRYFAGAYWRPPLPPLYTITIQCAGGSTTVDAYGQWLYTLRQLPIDQAHFGSVHFAGSASALGAFWEWSLQVF